MPISIRSFPRFLNQNPRKYDRHVFRLLGTACVLPLIIFCTPCREAQSSTFVPLETETYSVLNKALQAFMVEDNSTTASIIRLTRRPSERLSTCLNQTSDTTQWRSAVDDLRRKNFLTFVIEAKFDVPFTYELADEMEEVGGARNPPPGKDHFQFLREEMEKLENREREHFTQVQVSAPGISDDGQVAIVYIAVSFGAHFKVLHKTKDSWSVDPKPLCGVSS